MGSLHLVQASLILDSRLLVYNLFFIYTLSLILSARKAVAFAGAGSLFARPPTASSTSRQDRTMALPDRNDRTPYPRPQSRASVLVDGGDESEGIAVEDWNDD